MDLAKTRRSKMPRGVYPRRPNQLKAAIKNLAKGREKEAREKANKTLREIAQDPEWREKVSVATKKAMHTPEVRRRHLRGLKKARVKNGVNFRGGNGQEMTPIVRRVWAILKKEGFVREYPVKTEKVRSSFRNVSNAYKVDFAHPRKKIALELDGRSHTSKKVQMADHKKGQVLEALGWTVLRLKH